ncbi:hypothetical protein [Arthrobacter sp. NicSoilB11]|nr:hypothetical protein [Arthrobacter sp. NicSoilB11]BCW75921.1 hypothetical protein NicSoilB11_22460 [Arthrobacter sp. NicSoilB11]
MRTRAITLHKKVAAVLAAVAALMSVSSCGAQAKEVNPQSCVDAINQ